MAITTIDNESFLQVLATHSNMVYRIALHYMKNRADAEDVLQDTFVKLLEKQPSFDNSEHQKAWFVRVTINICKDRLRSFWNRKTVPLEKIVDKTVEYNHEVFDDLFKLKPRDRIVLYLYYYEQYTIKEISELLNTNANTISARLQRARLKLKIIIEEGKQLYEKR